MILEVVKKICVITLITGFLVKVLEKTGEHVGDAIGKKAKNFIEKEEKPDKRIVKR